MTNMIRRALIGASLALSMAIPQSVWADDWPDRPISMVIMSKELSLIHI